MATTIPFLTRQSFTAGQHVYQGALPQGYDTIAALLTVEGTATPSSDGGTYPAINGSISGQLFDSADGVTWRQRAGSTFVGGGGEATIATSGLLAQIKYIVTVVGGPTTATASGTLS